MELNYNGTDAKMISHYPEIRKKGVVSPNGEMTPFVFHGKLMRLESYSPDHCVHPERRNESCALIRDTASKQIISVFAHGCYFFDAYVEGDTVYVFGTLNNSIYGWYGGDTVMVFESTDLIHWNERVLFTKKDWLFFNHSMTKDENGYVFTVEVAKPDSVAGSHPFTYIFAKSKEIGGFEFLDYEKTSYPKDRYSGGSKIHYVNGWYYFLTLTEIPGPVYVFYLSRTKDFETWYLGKYNPFLYPDNRDFLISEDAADITDEMRAAIATGYFSSTSDVDFCEYNGKVIIDYIAGNQLGFCYLEEAEYDGSLQELLENFFI